MKKCYCGNENEDAAASCIVCGGTEFMGQRARIEPANTRVNPPKAPAPTAREIAPWVASGAFRLREVSGVDASPGAVTSSWGGLKKGILVVEGSRIELRQRLAVAGGFLLGTLCLVSMLLLLALPEFGPATENVKAVLATVLLAGTVVVPLIIALRLRRFARVYDLAEVEEAELCDQELELRLKSKSPPAAPRAAELMFKPHSADLPELIRRLSAYGVKVQDVGQRDRLAFQQSMLAATPRVWVTYSILAINVVVFLMVCLDGRTLAPALGLLKWGADYGPLSVNGHQWWRLLASCFLHFGILHLCFNMYALVQAGTLTERLFGNWFFLVIYLGCGLAGSLTSLWIHPAVVSAGASGAIFGVLGALLGYFAREGGALPPRVVRPVLTSAILFVVWNLFNGLLAMLGRYTESLTSPHPAAQSIDMAAHCGGLVSGLVFGYLGARPLAPGGRRALAWGRGVALLLGLGVAAGVLLLPVLKANQPNPTTMKMLAASYQNGDELPRDPAKSLHWLRRAAEAGDPASQDALGAMYFKGEGVEKSPATAVQWLTKAAAQGDVPAEKFLAGINFSGQGVPTNIPEGIRWLSKIADQNADQDYGELEKAVGLAYFQGDGVAKNQREAIKWMSRVARRGDPQARKTLDTMQQALAPEAGDLWLLRYAAVPRRDKAERVMTALRQGSNLDAAAATVGVGVEPARWYKAGELPAAVEAALKPLEDGSYVLVETDRGAFINYLIKHVDK